MAVHVFTVNETNFRLCVRKGLVAIPEPKQSNRRDSIFDGLLSRLSGIRDNDYILMYVIGAMELRGVWRADGLPFYDETRVWEDKIYPFRCRIKPSEMRFDKPLRLNDITELRNSGKLWTWAVRWLARSNTMFSISDDEFRTIVREFQKVNPFSMRDWKIEEPYPRRGSELLSHVHLDGQKLKYEYSVMAHLNHAFSLGRFRNIFGNYTDEICYVPTSFGKEMDCVLIYDRDGYDEALSYDIIEVKLGRFDQTALSQLIDYEAWFLYKKVLGDHNMVRTTAIARSFSDDVIDYVRKREKYENKPIKLVLYGYSQSDGFLLNEL